MSRGDGLVHNTNVHSVDAGGRISARSCVRPHFLQEWTSGRWKGAGRQEYAAFPRAMTPNEALKLTAGLRSGRFGARNGCNPAAA